MNTELPRIISLIRKEKHLSQKQAAKDLGVAQALLSHYEKGKRECGLDFLVRAADYYHVSADYLLGRSPSSTGALLTEDDLPGNMGGGKPELGSFSANLTKKLIMNSIEIIFSLLAKTKNQKFLRQVSGLLSLSVYRAFRLVYRLNPRNDINIFSINDEMAHRGASSLSDIYEGRAVLEIAEDAGNGEDLPELTTRYLETEYQKQAAALQNLIKNCEANISKII